MVLPLLWRFRFGRRDGCRICGGVIAAHGCDILRTGAATIWRAYPAKPPEEGKTMNNSTNNFPRCPPCPTPAEAGHGQRGRMMRQTRWSDGGEGKHTATASRSCASWPDGCADLVFTDPPILCATTTGQAAASPMTTYLWMFPALRGTLSGFETRQYAISFYGWGKAERFLSVWRECGFRPVGHFVWVKRYASCVRRVQMKQRTGLSVGKGNPLPPQCPPADVLPWSYHWQPIASDAKAGSEPDAAC